MTTADRPPDDPLRALVSVLAIQADILVQYLEQIYEEAYLGTAGGAVVERLGDDAMTIEFGDGALGRQPPFEDRRLVVTYRRSSGEVTLAYLPAAPTRPPAASDPSPRDGAARGRRSGAPRPRRPPR